MIRAKHENHTSNADCEHAGVRSESHVGRENETDDPGLEEETLGRDHAATPCPAASIETLAIGYFHDRFRKACVI